ARHQFFLHMNVFRIEPPFVKGALRDDWRELLIHDELCLHGIATDVPFGAREQSARFDQAENVTEVQVALDDLGDFLATHVAKIASFAAGHEWKTDQCLDAETDATPSPNSTSVTGQGNHRRPRMLTEQCSAIASADLQNPECRWKMP